MQAQFKLACEDPMFVEAVTDHDEEHRGYLQQDLHLGEPLECYGN